MKYPLIRLEHLKVVTVAATRFIFFAKWSDFDIRDYNSPAISGLRSIFVRTHGKARLPMNMEARFLSSSSRAPVGIGWGDTGT